MRTKLAIALATWLGCGYFPWGPGTVGSLAAVAIAAALEWELGLGTQMLLLLITIVLLPAILAATQTARVVAKKDPQIVVVDEVLGQWLTLAGSTVLNLKSLIAGFLLFRLFDIWKPWPVRQLERLPEGVGIVADDLAAGLYGALILYIGGRLRLY